MFDEKTIYTRLAMALCDAIAIEKVPVRRHEMEHMLEVMRNRFKPQTTELQHQAILKKPTP